MMTASVARASRIAYRTVASVVKIFGRRAWDAPRRYPAGGRNRSAVGHPQRRSSSRTPVPARCQEPCAAKMISFTVPIQPQQKSVQPKAPAPIDEGLFLQSSIRPGNLRASSTDEMVLQAQGPGSPVVDRHSGAVVDVTQDRHLPVRKANSSRGSTVRPIDLSGVTSRTCQSAASWSKRHGCVARRSARRRPHCRPRTRRRAGVLGAWQPWRRSRSPYRCSSPGGRAGSW